MFFSLHHYLSVKSLCPGGLDKSLERLDGRDGVRGAEQALVVAGVMLKAAQQHLDVPARTRLIHGVTQFIQGVI